MEYATVAVFRRIRLLPWSAHFQHTLIIQSSFLLSAHFPLQVNDLRFLTQPVMRLLEAGQLFAVHQVEGRQRHAKVTTADGRLFLHSLQDQQLPLGAGTLQVSEEFLFVFASITKEPFL